MERGAKPAKAKIEAKPRAATKSLETDDSAGRQFEQRLAEALEHQAATSEILRVISSSPADAQPVFDIIGQRAGSLCGAEVSVVSRVEGELIHLAALDGVTREAVETIKRYYPMRLSAESATARSIRDRSVVHLPDVLADARYDMKDAAVAGAWRSALAVPMLREGKVIGAIFVGRLDVGCFADSKVELLKTFADQAVIAIENARLFREIEVKSRQLKVASQHKSEFLANMSHELRTPLNAIIGFSEVLSERMFGEVNDKQAEYLSDILESGRHLLSLINDILDLSKIEAGRTELELNDFDLPSALENALTLVKERAHRRGIALVRTVDERLGMIHADERKVKQVVLNLLSNALKFTPEGGQIGIRARVHDREAEISVTDTGVGIAPEDQAVVFEEFRQVGTASKKVEGTGLGLAISRKFIELHGGRIWVDSHVGRGSTFAFTLPLTRDQRH